MKERPILFSAPMVRALLAGTKTQTRRVVQSPSRKHPEFVLLDYAETGWWPYLSDDGESSHLDDGNEIAIDCPYGQPGDRLWVRENGWERPERSQRDMREGADTWPPYEYDAEPVSSLTVEDMKAWKWKRRPSIHMPRWASRITLEVVAVRVERLQEISEADAQAEGMEPYEPDDAVQQGPRWFRMEYEDLWNKINGPGSWDANPWVWVVEFKRITT